MARLRVLSGREACEILAQHGFTEVRRRGGSHIIMQMVGGGKHHYSAGPRPPGTADWNITVNHPAIGVVQDAVRVKDHQLVPLAATNSILLILKSGKS